MTALEIIGVMALSLVVVAAALWAAGWLTIEITEDEDA